MAIAIISDIHSNIEALEAVLEHIETKKEEHNITDIYCLGDIVGYGPNPKEAVALIKQKCSLVLKGNHDEVVLNQQSILLANCNKPSQISFDWTRAQLNQEELEYLAGLQVCVERNNAVFVHGTPFYKFLPAMHKQFLVSDQKNAVDIASLANYCKFDYTMKKDQLPQLNDTIVRAAFTSLENWKKQVCFVGHTHVPNAFQYSEKTDPKIMEINLVGDTPPSRDEQLFEDEKWEFPLNPDDKYVINPGSVGQPRNDDRRASYGIYDAENKKFFNYRVPYSWSTTILKLMKVDVPQHLGYRLIFGH